MNKPLTSLSYDQRTFLELIRLSLKEKEFLPDRKVNLPWMHKTAKQQQLLPLIYRAAEPLPEFQELSREKRSEWRLEAMRQMALQLGHDEALKRICGELEKKGISYIILKGMTCRYAYPEPELRPSADEDILIRPEDCRCCDGILKENGYILKEQNLLKENSPDKIAELRELHYYSPEDRMLLELHLNAIGKENERNKSLNQYFDQVFERTAVLAADDCKLTMLEPTLQLMHIFAHFFRHFCEAGAGLRQMLDILLTARKYQDEIDWHDFEKMLEEISGTRLFWTIIKAGERYLDLQIEGLPHTLKKEAVETDSLLADMFAGGVYGYGETGERQWSHFATESEKTGSGKKRKIVAAVLFPPAVKMKERYPVLLKRPVLLPFFHMIRWLQLIWEYSRKPSRIKRAKEGLRKGNARRELMKELGIMK